MGNPAAKQGDTIIGIDTHVVLVPSPGGPIPTPMPMPFSGALSGALSASVAIDNQPAATLGSSASNTAPHVAPGGTFQTPPSNEATIQSGSATVFIDDKQVARLGDPALTCNDPSDAPNGSVIASGTVVVGG